VTREPGAATLLRSEQCVELRIATSGLDPNTAYTVWWVVFNNRAACVPACNPTPLGNPAVRASAFYAAGFVTGSDSTANVTAHVEAGALPIGGQIADGTVAGLDHGNGFGAEIHVVVRSQGFIVAGDSRCANRLADRIVQGRLSVEHVPKSASRGFSSCRTIS
jgi:hypothetical protein